jgi:protein-disulfide isomerase
MSGGAPAPPAGCRHKDRRSIAFGLPHCSLSRLTHLVGTAFAVIVMAFAVPVGSALGLRDSDWAWGKFAGYLWRGHVTSVRASWTVPRVLGAGGPIAGASTWIGAEAIHPHNAFIQIGTQEERVAPPGRAPENVYFAWWSDIGHEFLAQHLFRVKPGDSLSASLVLAPPGQWTLTIADSTSGTSAHFSTNEETNAEFNQAEWLQEHPGGEGQIPLPYPQLTTVHFRQLQVNSAAPKYADLYSQWMSVIGRSLAPSPLRDDSFTIRSATISAAGAWYLHTVLPATAAADAFSSQLAKWTAATPYLQMASANSTDARALREAIHALAGGRWPKSARGPIRSLIHDWRSTLARLRLPAPANPTALAEWRAAWERTSEANEFRGASETPAHPVARALNVPDIVPAAPSIRPTRLSLKGVAQHNETLGNPRAPVKMVYFGDPQCRVCLQWQEAVLPALVRKYVNTGWLQIQWQGIEVIGPASLTGERFIVAAGLQNHLWNVLDDVMANQGEENSGWLNVALLEEVGASIRGLNGAAAMAAALSPATTGELDAAFRLFEGDHLTGVPAFLLGPRSGPLRTFEYSEFEPPEWERAINRLLPKRDR